MNFTLSGNPLLQEESGLMVVAAPEGETGCSPKLNFIASGLQTGRPQNRVATQVISN